jgi:hypothetical protein
MQETRRQEAEGSADVHRTRYSIPEDTAELLVKVTLTYGYQCGSKRETDKNNKNEERILQKRIEMRQVREG